MASHFSIIKLILILLSLFLIIKPTKAQTYFNGTISENCAGTCGNITIPYPFGIGMECAYDWRFNISCDDNTSFPINKPFLIASNREVSRITLEIIRVYIPPNNCSLIGDIRVVGLDWYMMGKSNICGSNAYRRDLQYPRFNCECERGYEGNPYLPDGCQDINECEQRDPYCTGEGYFCTNYVGGFTCRKRRNKARKRRNKARIIGIGTLSGFGVVLLLLGLWWSYKKIKRRRKMNLKKQFFKRNGGLLLEQELSTRKEGHVEKTKLFTSKELEKATNHYNKSRILGHGGQGTVYKGMLDDGRIVAIKVSKVVNKGNLQQFINEVVILSQINHRNIVKLHGCCLETEVPLLVYEYVPNGTLFDYIHHGNEEFPLSWNVRLRIATEAATALSYLHSSATVPIYHRDIKSTNILLDDKYKAKVADFGTSRSTAIDQTHLTTCVLGTFGYLDPEYFQSSQFTDKSDVYSFGVVLLELLTGQKPISVTTSGEGQSLVRNFILVMEENRLFDMIDARVIKEGSKNEINGVAKLAGRCLNLNGRKRPTMNEVARELELIRMSNGSCDDIN